MMKVEGWLDIAGGFHTTEEEAALADAWEQLRVNVANNTSTCGAEKLIHNHLVKYGKDLLPILQKLFGDEK